MIDTTNFKEMLLSLGFNENEKNVFSKNCGESLDCILTADFKNKKLRYPEQIRINDQTTTNFEHPENFVVFERGMYANFSRPLRVSTDRVKALDITLPSLREQEQVVQKFEELEKKITEAEIVLSSAQKQKNDILDKWL